MLYTFFNVVIKNPDWKMATIRGADDTEYHDVSINRTNKKGETFPRFDEIANGAQIEGTFWLSQNGKGYLFPPKAPKARSGPSTAAITQAQDRKKADIAVAQENKEASIKISSTARDATLITVELLKADPLAEWHEVWQKARKYLWDNWDYEKAHPPF